MTSNVWWFEILKKVSGYIDIKVGDTDVLHKNLLMYSKVYAILLSQFYDIFK